MNRLIKYFSFNFIWVLIAFVLDFLLTAIFNGQLFFPAFTTFSVIVWLFPNENIVLKSFSFGSLILLSAIYGRMISLEALYLVFVFLSLSFLRDILKFSQKVSFFVIFGFLFLYTCILKIACLWTMETIFANMIFVWLVLKIFILYRVDGQSRKII